MADNKKKNIKKAEEAVTNDVKNNVSNEEENVEVEVITTEEKESAEELEALKAEILEQKDLFLRKIAEFDNYKKRTARETERIGLDSRAAVLKSILPAVENFKRALSAPESGYEDYKKGVELSIRQFIELLKQIGLEEINPENETFDPNIHYAVSQIEDEKLSKNTVAQVLQCGYKIGDIVIRPAMVSVANCE